MFVADYLLYHHNVNRRLSLPRAFGDSGRIRMEVLYVILFGVLPLLLPLMGAVETANSRKHPGCFGVGFTAACLGLDIPLWFLVKLNQQTGYSVGERGPHATIALIVVFQMGAIWGPYLIRRVRSRRAGTSAPLPPPGPNA